MAHIVLTIDGTLVFESGAPPTTEEGVGEAPSEPEATPVEEAVAPETEASVETTEGPAEEVHAEESVVEETAPASAEEPTVEKAVAEEPAVETAMSEEAAPADEQTTAAVTETVVETEEGKA